MSEIVGICTIFVQFADEAKLPAKIREELRPDLSDIETLLKEPGEGLITFSWLKQTYTCTHGDQEKVFEVSKYSKILSPDGAKKGAMNWLRTQRCK